MTADNHGWTLLYPTPPVEAIRSTMSGIVMKSRSKSLLRGLRACKGNQCFHLQEMKWKKLYMCHWDQTQEQLCKSVPLTQPPDRHLVPPGCCTADKALLWHQVPCPQLGPFQRPSLQVTLSLCLWMCSWLPPHRLRTSQQRGLGYWCHSGERAGKGSRGAQSLEPANGHGWASCDTASCKHSSSALTLQLIEPQLHEKQCSKATSGWGGMGWWPGPGKPPGNAASFAAYPQQPAHRAIIKFWALHKTGEQQSQGLLRQGASCAVWVALGNQPSPFWPAGIPVPQCWHSSLQTKCARIKEATALLPHGKKGCVLRVYQSGESWEEPSSWWASLASRHTGDAHPPCRHSQNVQKVLKSCPGPVS